jgi:hypothetical protein
MGRVKDRLQEFVEPLEFQFFKENGEWPEGDDLAALYAIAEDKLNEEAKEANRVK